MKFKYVVILLFLYSEIAFAKYTFVPLEEYESEIYSLGLNENNRGFSSNFSLASIANLDDATVVRLSKYDIRNNFIKNKKYPNETLRLLQGYKNKELTKLLIPMFNGLNYDLLQRNNLGYRSSNLYSSFVYAIKNQEIEEKTFIFKNRLDYWLNLYNKPTNPALEAQEKYEISAYIMLLADTLQFYQKETLSDKEYKKISKIHLKSSGHFLLGHLSRRSGGIEVPFEDFLLKSKFSDFEFNNFGSIENYFKLLINKYKYDIPNSNTNVDIIYYKNKALLRWHTGIHEGSRGGETFLLTIKENRMVVKSLGSWYACGPY